MNKALEIIELHHLFGLEAERIDVVIHPQSIVHSMVEFVDGSTIAQASPPDMRLPISLGLDWPHRVAGVGVPLDWTRAQQWTFEPLDDATFPAVALARRVGELGGTFPAVYNAANEQAVEAFHAHRVPFLGIVETVRRVVDVPEPGPATLEGVLAAESWARDEADRLLAGGVNG
jgi:1-deoxy-D-xylulose-5-phosphate reductoisomerase